MNPYLNTRHSLRKCISLVRGYRLKALIWPNCAVAYAGMEHDMLAIVRGEWSQRHLQNWYDFKENPKDRARRRQEVADLKARLL